MKNIFQFQCCGMNGANDFGPYNLTIYPHSCCNNIQQNQNCTVELAKNSTVQGCDLALRPHNADVNIELKTMAGVTIGSLTSQVCDIFFFFICSISLYLFLLLLDAFHSFTYSDFPH